jgi:hypothetical protein
MNEEFYNNPLLKSSQELKKDLVKYKKLLRSEYNKLCKKYAQKGFILVENPISHYNGKIFFNSIQ